MDDSLASLVDIDTLYFKVSSSSNVSQYDMGPKIKFIPNPITSYRVISIDIDFSNSELVLYNIYGNKIFQRRIVSREMTLFRDEQLESGLYIFQLFEKNVPVAFGKILKIGK
jgi:hypothetical protein